MHRFFLPPVQSNAANLVLTGREAHQALHVLRLRRGEQVTILDGAGTRLVSEVVDCGRDVVCLQVLQRTATAAPRCRVTLLQALPKGKIIEDIIQKATELGVSRVVPLLAERTTARLDGEAGRKKAAKWQAVAIEAIKQCGLAWLPTIEPPVPPEEFLRRQETFDLSLIASLRPGSRPAREYFQLFKREHRQAPRSVCLWVGPEGDFTPAEVDGAEAAGALPITLGPLVLRVETAAVYCLSILNHELQAWVSPAS